MTKLSDTQRLVLSSACQHVDGIATRSSTLRPAQAAKMLAFLIENGFVKEIRAKSGMPVWRQDEQNRGIAVKILKAGRLAVAAVCPAEAPISDDASSGTGLAPDPVVQPAGTGKGSGSKRALIIGLMQREQGATIDDLIAVTDWLPHTTRAALSVLRKSGLMIERNKGDRGSGSVYRIVVGAFDVAA